MADATAVREITDRLENGVKDLFESDKYAEYLKTMSRFHKYSTRNTLLIHLQSPEARRVGGFRFWQQEFNRHVRKGERGIKIFAPIAANKGKEIEVEKLDPVTKLPVLDDNGQPIMETLSPLSDLRVRFRLVTVFSEQQTEGDPIPELAETLTGDVERYELFMDTLRAVSPLPIVFEQLTDQDGYCAFGEKIAIREGMSEIQTVAAVIHEIAHAKLHDRNSLAENEKPKSAKVAELEAESVAYVVAQAFQIDTGANSFGYLAGWNPDTEMKDFNASLDTVRKTAASLIDAVSDRYRALAEERGIDLTVTPEKPAGEDDRFAKMREEAQTAVEYTEFQKKGLAFAEAHAGLPLQDRLNIIVRTFGYETASVETNPCTGKWRGTSDIAVVFADDRATLFIGNERTQDAKKASVISECVNNALAKYNPQTAEEAKQRASIALTERERADNAVAAELGLKPYTFLNVELNDGSNCITGGYLGWYYITVAVDGRIFGLCESGLNNDIARGGLEIRENYFVAGGLRETEPNFVFNNVGHSSESASYKMELSEEALRRARETLTRRERFQSAPEGMKSAGKSKPSPENGLYEKLSELFPDFMSGKYSYMKLESPGFEPLSLEWIFGDRISVMHTFVQEGDLCYDPMIEYAVNSEKRTLIPSSFQQSIPPLYQYHDDGGIGRSVDGNGNTHEAPNLKDELADFSAQWFNNIAGQGYTPVRARLRDGGGIDEAGVMIDFDAQGNPIPPEPAMSDERREMLIEAMRAAGYEYDGINSGEGYICFNGEHGGGDFACFEEVEEWLDGIVFDPDISDRVEVILHPERFAERKTQDAPETPEPVTQGVTPPDPERTVAEMNEYGYTEPDMYPLSAGRAVELFDSGHTIYLLYGDSTEVMAFDRDEIIAFGGEGFCGITKADWEMSPEYGARTPNADEPKNDGNAREADLLYGDNPYRRENKYGIYQIKDDADEAGNFRFASMRKLEAHGLSVNRDNYELVHTAALADRVEFLSDRNAALNHLYEKYNIDMPADYTGRSMSVSDVVVLRCNGDITAHYVDSAGFVELPGFTGDERKQSALSQVGTKRTDIPRKPAAETAPTLLGELAEAKQLVTRGDKSAAKQNEREV